MAGKDRKSMLKDSMTSEKDALAKRFDNADQYMQERPGGLLLPSALPTGDTQPSSQEEPSGRDEIPAVVQIPIDKLQDNPYNARQIYTMEMVKERAASIAKNGQLTPATVATDPDNPGGYIMVDGHYRKRALKLLERDTMDCVIKPVKTQLDLYRLSFVLNEERSSQTAIDNALAWKKMLDLGIVEKEETLCELTSMSWANVNKTLSLAKLPLAVIDRISGTPAKFGVALGYELFQFHVSNGEDATLKLINRILEEDLSSRAVEKLRKQMSKNLPRKPRELSRQYKIKRNGQDIGFIKDWDSGKIAIQITSLDANERAELVSELSKRFRIAESETFE